MIRLLTFLRVVFVTVSLVLFQMAAFAQTASRVTGVITDPTGAVVPGAKITVTDLRTASQRTATSDASGRYSVLNVPPGSYSVEIRAEGFSTQVQKPVTVEVSQILTLDFALSVGAMAETIEVSGQAPLVARGSADLSQLVTGQSLTELPISGRDYTRFSLLSPGAVARSNFIADLTFNGMHTNANDFAIDGINASRVDFAFPANGAERGARLLTGSLDSIAEFRIMTSSYNAEYGFSAAAKISIATKSGGNEVHGVVFYYLRNSVLDARNFFIPPPSPKPLYILNEFGGNVGGPIRRGKTFYFINYEGSRQRIGITGGGTVPSRSFRQQISTTSPALIPIIDTMPLGTEPTSDPRVDAVAVSQTSAVREDTGSLRVDHQFNEAKDWVMFRYNYNSTRVFGAAFGVIPTSFALNQFQDVPIGTTNFVLSEVHTFSSNVVNEFKIGMQRYTSDMNTHLTPHPNTRITGLTIIPGTGGGRRSNQNMFQVLDNLSVTSGRHNLKMGFEIRRVQINVQTKSRPSMIYTSLDDFLNNRLASATITPGDPGHGIRGTQMGYYFQDDIKLHPRFTLNLGIRYEFYTALNEAKDRVQPFNLRTGNLDPPGSPYYKADMNNWAPRIGFCWDVFGDARTAIRGGYGIYFQAPSSGLAGALDLNTFFGTTLLRSGIPNLSFPFDPFLPAGTNPPRNVAGFDPTPEDTSSTQWSLSVQRELIADLVLQVAYVGNHAYHLNRTMNTNLFDPALGRRPNSNFADISVQFFTGESNYNALQVSIRKRATHGLTFNMEYTWSHALDDVQDRGLFSSDPQDNNNLKAEYGNGSGDVRHNFASSFIYELPLGRGRRWLQKLHGVSEKLVGGWQVEGLAILRSGIPFTVLTGKNTFGNFNFINQRPDAVSGVPSRPAGGRTINNWLNPAAFAVPAQGTFGNLGRNTEFGPSLGQFDLSLIKNISITKTKNLQFRAEFFNVFNHPNFAQPTPTLLSPAFGRVFQTFGATIGLGTPRQIQFALRFRF